MQDPSEGHSIEPTPPNDERAMTGQQLYEESSTGPQRSSTSLAPPKMSSASATRSIVRSCSRPASRRISSPTLPSSPTPPSSPTQAGTRPTVGRRCTTPPLRCFKSSAVAVEVRRRAGRQKRVVGKSGLFRAHPARAEQPDVDRAAVAQAGAKGEPVCGPCSCITGVPSDADCNVREPIYDANLCQMTVASTAWGCRSTYYVVISQLGRSGACACRPSR